jgi:hypothetical protein
MANSNEGPPIHLRPHRSKRNPNDDPRRYGGVVGSVLRFGPVTQVDLTNPIPDISNSFRLS